jgi:hypothetical protein
MPRHRHVQHRLSRPLDPARHIPSAAARTVRRVAVHGVFTRRARRTWRVFLAHYNAMVYALLCARRLVLFECAVVGRGVACEARECADWRCDYCCGLGDAMCDFRGVHVLLH